MTRRSFFSIFASLIAMVVMAFFAGSGSASAQNNPNLCYYTVDIAGILPHCFPINLQTEWNCGGMIKVDNLAFAANGVYLIALNPGGNPPCPPACRFNWASLNGIINPTPLNQTKKYMINNCCYILTPTLDANGAVYITIRPC